jgi:hypothetical protein
MGAQFEAHLIEEPDEGSSTRLSFAHFWSFVAQEAVDAATSEALGPGEHDPYVTPSKR